MTQTATIPPPPLPALAPADASIPRRRITADEYDRMIEVGILAREERVELWDGEILEMPPIGPPHGGHVDWLNMHFAPLLKGRAIVRIQGSMRLTSASEPEPDLLVLRPRADFYRGALPKPGDVLLLIEVSESSVARDRDFKLPRYAQAAIAEVWLVQTQERVVTVCREPGPRGYARVERFGADAVISPAAFPDAGVPLRELFAGPAE